MAYNVPREILVQKSSKSSSPQECLKYIASILPTLENYIQRSVSGPPACSEEDVCIMKTIFKALNCPSDRELIVEVLNVFRETQAVDYLIRLLSTLEGDSCTEESMDIITTVVEILDQLQSCMPSSSLQLQGLLFVLEDTAEKIKSSKKLKQRISSIKDTIHRSINAQKRKIVATENVDRRKPPGDFRRIPIYPRRDDIFPEQKPFLRKVITDGRYDDLEHYLDVQFRLFREDCIAQLRMGVQEYRQEYEDGNHPRRLENARIYDDVRILFRETSLDGILHVAQLSKKTYENIDWSSTKRLIHGTLVCLSFDHFETFAFATIFAAESDILRVRGIFKIKIVSESIALKGNILGCLCKIIESTALFEAYKYGLEKLKNTRPGQLAFEKYFVRCETNIGKADYMEKDQMYDLSPIINNCPVKIGNVHRHQEFKRLSDTTNWPSTDELHMNPSQYEAFKSALTKEFCIIQGPPGTGKSYLGLQIVKTLLANTSCWSAGTISPIILVCFTNHALDQFLENILCSVDQSYRDKIVRVGGRSKIETIEAISLRKRSERTYRKNRLNNLHILQKGISKYSEMINRIPFTIVDHVNLGMRIALPSGQFSLKDEKSMFRWLNVDKRGILDSAERNEWNGNNLNVLECIKQEKEMRRNVYEDAYYDLTSSVEPSEFPDLRIEESPNVQFGMNILAVWRSLSNERNTDLRDKIKCEIDNILGEMNSGDDISDIEAALYEDQNLWNLSIPNRWKLYRHWKNKFCRSIMTKIEIFKAYQDDILEDYKDEKFINEFRVLNRASLIAMTTTGAAKYHMMLQLLQPRITIIDEAAEVLEAHILASLTSSCQHLILIGDHKQLEPKPAVYELAQKYHMSLSFFERMIRNGVPYHCLLKQHRMRPDISILVKEIYPGLHDAENVGKYEHVGGVEKDIFFLNHDFKESYQDEGRSYENVFEAEFTTRMCEYLLYQGYKASQITILTPYSGQVRCLSKFVNTKMRDVRISIVDNYQGEENDIVLLSMVRSNDTGKLGFLDKENRVCVALSRARIGLFVVGNFDMMCTYAKKTQFWNTVVKTLKEKGCFGTELSLFCQNHPKRQIQAKNASDFDSCPEGGCQVKCDARLLCGHACRRFCHPEDQNHKSYICYVQCLSTCSSGHTCDQLCHFPDPCNCKVFVPKAFKCGHVNEIECYRDPNKEQCDKIVTKHFRNCGHSIEIPCHVPVNNYTCEEIVERKLLCGHTARVQCHTKFSRVECSELMEKIWSCGHSAQIQCRNFNLARCQEEVVRMLECGHENWMKCHVDPEYFDCKHIVEKFFLKCGHAKQVPCHQDVEKELCTEVLVLKRECGHEDKCLCSEMKTNRKKKCEHICGRTCERDHKCRRPCHFPEDCNCRQSVQKQIPECGHFATVDCFQDPNEFPCTELICKEVPSCGHLVEVECSNTMENFKCVEEIEKYREMCGHYTITECYKDPESSFCTALVSKRLGCGHDCKVMCGEEFFEIQCMENVTKSVPCGHEIEVVCYDKDRENLLCSTKLEYILECGHFITICCYEYQMDEIRDNIKCSSFVETELSCGHFSTVPCSLSHTKQICSSLCESTLSCGHACTASCETCQKRGYHERCTQCCNMQLLCGHKCNSELCESCEVCNRECEQFCDHKRCGKRCFEICDLCISPCSWKCPHYQCSLLCHEICDRPRCSLPCPKKLKCHHKCLGFCGEPCPPHCSQCDSYILEETVIKLEGKSCLVYLPDCKHFFESSVLDDFITQMKPHESLKCLSCPKCSTPITWHPRYNKVIKLQRKRINLSKAITVYLTESKSWEFLPLFCPSLLTCQEYIENCRQYSFSVGGSVSENCMTALIDQVSDHIDTIRNAMRPSFDQYKSVYDAIRRISQQWQMIIEEDNPHTERTNEYDSFVEEYCNQNQESSDVVNVGHNSALMDRASSLPNITLMADPHMENWKVCKEGILNLYNFYLCLACTYIASGLLHDSYVLSLSSQVNGFIHILILKPYEFDRIVCNYTYEELQFLM